ncbi:MAG TPA: helix-turn-helix transcriptional regulator [Halothiobacillus sp.]|nr:helix-turn-helix transcriptional regulator [Halothiobacillus sp.]
MSDKKPASPADIARRKAVGDRIRTLRLQKGYTQSELSTSIDLSANACSQWEGGYAMPKIEHLEQLARVLDTTTEWLMTGDNPDELDKIHTTAERDVVKLIRQIPSSQHDLARQLLSTLIPKPKL